MVLTILCSLSSYVSEQRRNSAPDLLRVPAHFHNSLCTGLPEEVMGERDQLSTGLPNGDPALWFRRKWNSVAKRDAICNRIGKGLHDSLLDHVKLPIECAFTGRGCRCAICVVVGQKWFNWWFVILFSQMD